MRGYTRLNICRALMEYRSEFKVVHIMGITQCSECLHFTDQGFTPPPKHSSMQQATRRTCLAPYLVPSEWMRFMDRSRAGAAFSSSEDRRVCPIPRSPRAGRFSSA